VLPDNCGEGAALVETAAALASTRYKKEVRLVIVLLPNMEAASLQQMRRAKEALQAASKVNAPVFAGTMVQANDLLQRMLEPA
jgi:hypothetical protein